MKKNMFCTVLILLLFLCFPAFAAGGKLSAAPVSGKNGEQVRITVRLDNPGIVATRIFVSYDSKVLTLKQVENGEVFTANQATFGKDLSADPYTILWDDSLNTANNTKSGALVTLTFTVHSGNADGKTNVRFSVDKASTFDTNLSEVSVADCTCIVGVPTVASKDESAAKTDPAVQTSAKPASSPKPDSTDKSIPTAKGTPASTGKAVPTTAAKTGTPSVKLTAPSKAAQTVPTSVTVPPEEQLGSVTAPPTETQKTVSRSTASAEENAEQAQSKPSDSVPFASISDSTAADEYASKAEKQTGRKVSPKPAWLLLLIPVAAAVLVGIQKKKNN